jgi:hypothetical protein
MKFKVTALCDCRSGITFLWSLQSVLFPPRSAIRLVPYSRVHSLLPSRFEPTTWLLDSNSVTASEVIPHKISSLNKGTLQIWVWFESGNLELEQRCWDFKTNCGISRQNNRSGGWTLTSERSEFQNVYLKFQNSLLSFRMGTWNFRMRIWNFRIVTWISE